AKAVVRHLGPMRCGIQFIAMSAEQLTALRTWARMAGERSGEYGGPELVQENAVAPVQMQPATVDRVKPRKRLVGAGGSPGWRPQLRWFVLLLIATLAGLSWWWYHDWDQLEDTTSTAVPGEESPVQVPGMIMQQHLLHRVDPEYPAEAEQTRLKALEEIRASIVPDGTVKHVQPGSRPPLLPHDASDAGRRCSIQPYTANGL